MAKLIKIIGVSKVYNPGENQINALNNIDFSLTEGEFISIVGSSGSGKSTLMNILGCLDTPTSGKYLLDGIDVSTINDDTLSNIRNRKIGFIFQGFNLIPSLNAIENVELPLLYRGVSKIKRLEIVKESLSRVGLSDRLYHRPAQMSGGQQQRVAIARALAAKPSLILADEPTGNLDSNSGSEVMDILKELNNEGKSIILITHDDKLAALADRKIRISDGKICSDKLNK